MKEKLNNWIQKQENSLKKIEKELSKIKISSEGKKIETVGKLFLVKQREDMLKGSKAIIENLRKFIKEEL